MPDPDRTLALFDSEILACRLNCGITDLFRSTFNEVSYHLLPVHLPVLISHRVVRILLYVEHFRNRRANSDFVQIIITRGHQIIDSKPGF